MSPIEASPEVTVANKYRWKRWIKQTTDGLYDSSINQILQSLTDTEVVKSMDMNAKSVLIVMISMNHYCLFISTPHYSL
ncbi:hypothetical protein O3M35_010286 [Rhynocoris fuscipes]|uniref:Uncharacterized protein n=1 Tax=Rhynocoris fuscipes TaxID=488301 RepID=A0AAW1D3T4_9HEMI